MMLVGDHVSYPGVIVEARTLAILHVLERDAGEDEAKNNPRIITIPEWLKPALGEAMLRPLRDDIRDFLVRVGQDADKEILDAQWGPADEADAYIRKHRRRGQ